MSIYQNILYIPFKGMLSYHLLLNQHYAQSAFRQPVTDLAAGVVCHITNHVEARMCRPTLSFMAALTQLNYIYLFIKYHYYMYKTQMFARNYSHLLKISKNQVCKTDG